MSHTDTQFVPIPNVFAPDAIARSMGKALSDLARVSTIVVATDEEATINYVALAHRVLAKSAAAALDSADAEELGWRVLGWEMCNVVRMYVEGNAPHVLPPLGPDLFADCTCGIDHDRFCGLVNRFTAAAISADYRAAMNVMRDSQRHPAEGVERALPEHVLSHLRCGQLMLRVGMHLSGSMLEWNQKDNAAPASTPGTVTPDQLLTRLFPDDLPDGVEQVTVVRAGEEVGSWKAGLTPDQVEGIRVAETDAQREPE